MPDEELSEDGTDADFDSGYAGSQTAKQPETPEAGKEKTADTTTAAEGKTGAAGADATPVVPEYAQLTKTEREELLAAASRVAAYDKKFASIDGSLGYLKQHIKPAADATAGQQPKEGAAATPAPEAAAVMTPADAILAHELSVLTSEIPNWREIVGAPDQGGMENVNKAHPFRVWLATQPAAYQAKLNEANSSLIIMRAIEKFNDDTAKAAAKAKETPSPAATQRKAVIKDAIQPRGDGGAPTPAKTEEDHFAEGFASG